MLISTYHTESTVVLFQHQLQISGLGQPAKHKKQAHAEVSVDSWLERWKAKRTTA